MKKTLNFSRDFLIFKIQKYTFCDMLNPFIWTSILDNCIMGSAPMGPTISKNHHSNIVTKMDRHLAVCG